MILKKTNSIKKHIKALFLLVMVFQLPMQLQAQTVAKTDTINSPEVSYSYPRKYEIAGITVTGAESYDDYVVIGYSGLTVGEIITIPGDEITSAIKRFWKQGLFSDVSITLTKTVGNKAWLNISLTEQPRVTEVRFQGMKKSEKEELVGKIGISKGSQVNQNIIDRAKKIIKKYYDEKGYKNAEVRIIQHPDLSKKNYMIVDIYIDKKTKVKVHKVYLSGNEVVTDKQLKRTMKKTNEKGDILKLFKSKKFIENEYKEDLNLIIDKYNELGYRDARIVSDSVVPYEENMVDVYIQVEEGQKYYLKSINWVGNTVYPTELLSQLLRMSPGDVYNQKLLRQRMLEDEDGISTLYMDNGYLSS